MLDTDRLTTITFDCYGTLVDWEFGIVFALRAVLSNHGVGAKDPQIVDIFHRFHSEERARAYRPYKEVLADIVQKFADHFRFALEPGEMHAISQAVGAWRPFRDTVDALRSLGRRYRLGIISNIDDDLFEQTAVHLPVAFDAVVTSEQARCYKPDPRIFRLALERLDARPAEVLHAGQWLEGDILPARSLGLATAWVRRSRRSPASSDAPDLQVPDLKSLVERVRPDG